MNIVLIGIQGSGKGTLVSGLLKHIDFTLISMGQLLRNETKTGSIVGEEIKARINNGLFVDTEVILPIVEKKISEANKKIVVFDGFPRTLEQAEKLDELLKVDLVINLELDKQFATSRLLNRLTCENCGYISSKFETDDYVCPICGGKLKVREDDTEESINKRFSIYEQVTLPLITKYKQQGVKVISVDANDIDKTLDAVLKVLNEYNY